MNKGLLLLNMGGPNNLDEVEVFLKNMFNDPNIITVKSSFLRRFIAFMITTFRTKEAKKNYEALGGKSPIVDYTKALVAKLQKRLPETKVDFAMAYTPPFASKAIEGFMDEGITKLDVFPLYPHYSTTTVKSSLEDFSLHVKRLGADFDVKIAKKFYKNSLYNELLVELIQESLGGQNSQEYDLIFSAHSLPQKIVDKGDPYQKQVVEHVGIVTKILRAKNIIFNKIHLAYQSKLGPVKWLEPELGQKLKELENKKAIIVPLSFTIDNSETEFELCIEYEEEAKELGFEEYKVVKCPNSNDKFVEMIAQVAENSPLHVKEK